MAGNEFSPEEVIILNKNPYTLKATSKWIMFMLEGKKKILAHCGEIVDAQEIVPALGHDFQLTEDTSTEKIYTCSRCGQTRTEVEQTTPLSGDVTGDGKVPLSDVVRLLKYVSKWDVTINEANSDVTGDGKITLSDVVRLLKYVSKWDVVLQ